MRRIALQGPLHGSSGFVDEGKKPTHVITIINVSNQMVAIPKDIYNKLNSNKPDELIKGKQNYSSIRMQLAWDQPIILKNFPHKPLKRKGIPQLIYTYGGNDFKVSSSGGQGRLANSFNLRKQFSHILLWLPTIYKSHLIYS
jgi:hypothetical protein